MFTHATRLMLALLAALPACAADKFDNALSSASGDGSESSASSDALDDEGDPNAREDEVFPEDEEGPHGEAAPPEMLLACDLLHPCEFPVELVRESQTQSYTDSDLCALKALASARSGFVQTVTTFASAESYLDHVVTAPGEVLRQAHGRSDGVGLWQKQVERCVLKDAAFFAACAESYDPACLNPDLWVADCEVLDSLTCPLP